MHCLDGMKSTGALIEKPTPPAKWDMKVNQIQELENRLAELQRKIRETEQRLPAHSVKPPIMTELFDLEDEYEALLVKLRKLKARRGNYRD
jgi:chromosome segregation ATPase